MIPIASGLIAAIPVSVLGIGYTLWRGDVLVKLIMEDTADPNSLTHAQLYYLFLAAVGLMPFVFGVLAGAVYSWVNNPIIFLVIAIGSAVVLTILAWRSKTPGALEKNLLEFHNCYRSWPVCTDPGWFGQVKSGQPYKIVWSPYKGVR